MKFIATAEHCGGGSVGHPCTFGAYGDPTDYFQEEVTGDTVDLALDAAHAELEAIVAKCEPCKCQRKLEPGWDSWWNSISIALWPQDAESFAAWRGDDDDEIDDPYGLIPDDLKPAVI